MLCDFYKMDKNIEQRICLKFCVANGISCAELLKMLKKAYSDSYLSKTQAYEWYKAFKEGREVIEDLLRSGRQSRSKIKLLLTVFFDYRDCPLGISSGGANSQQTILSRHYEAFERECSPEKAWFVEEQFMDFASR